MHHSIKVNLTLHAVPFLLLLCYEIIIKSADSLICWQCISDDCANDPSDNYKASKKVCSVGQSCQKVHFEMYSPTDKRKYFSTVRGCASNCESKNDFENCTLELFNSRGCVEKHCCENIDLCNMASDLTFHAHVFLSIPLCHVIFYNILW
ncbi:hypothetical protein CHS0354_007983 [Potamilus streckersoni]|uniref:Uncharacterized protein n=1 Tax=Potamilus streckersoni TaxID=2493646 RepID=A0AAE0VU31_9BIVA|nr:hypothetical protein CHS0354_007983 [Potamilus streckersoni]